MVRRLLNGSLDLPARVDTMHEILGAAVSCVSRSSSVVNSSPFSTLKGRDQCLTPLLCPACTAGWKLSEAFCQSLGDTLAPCTLSDAMLLRCPRVDREEAETSLPRQLGQLSECLTLGLGIDLPI